MKLEFHPLANLFPLIEGDDFADLVADVGAHGIHQPIDLYQGKILDGRNRYRAAEAADLEIGPQHIRYFRPELNGDPLAYVISQNLKRRHLDESQRAFVAAKLATMRQGERTDLAKAEPSANLPKVDQPTAAKLLNVSERSLRSAKVVHNSGTPELQRVVETGKLSVSAAALAARLAPERQEQIAREAEAGNANAVRTVIKREARAEREQRLADTVVALPTKKYALILCDDEWDHEVWSRQTGMDRHASNHYETAVDAHTAEELHARTRGRFECAAPDCLLAMWATVQHLAIAVDLMRLRGFRYVSHYAWGKDKAGLGYWNRNKHELLLFGVRGHIPCPAPGTQRDSLIMAPCGPHSAKPEAFLEMLEAYFPNLPKIELNRRGPPRPGWDAWGNEAAPPDEIIDPETGEITSSRANAGKIIADRKAVEPSAEGVEPPVSRLAGGRTPADRGTADAIAAPPSPTPAAAGAGKDPWDELDIPNFLRRGPDGRPQFARGTG